MKKKVRKYFYAVLMEKFVFFLNLLTKRCVGKKQTKNL